MDDFERLRGRLFGIAYRMLGTATDAEEIVQDAWLRWQGADPVAGRDRVARYLIGTLQRFGAGIEPHLAEANGRPALIAVGPEGVVAICFVDAGPDGVTDLRFVMNPDKLAFAAAQLSRIGGLPDLSW